MTEEKAVNYHVERDGKIIHGPSVAYSDDGLSQDSYGNGGWDACFAAQNRLERDPEHGPIQQGDLIVMQVDLDHVTVRRYYYKSPQRRGVYLTRFPPLGKEGQVYRGSVGVPFQQSAEENAVPILRPDGPVMLPQLRDLLEEASTEVQEVMDLGCLAHGRQAKLASARNGIDTVREYLGG